MPNGINLGRGNPNIPLGGDISRSALVAELLKGRPRGPLLSPGALAADIGTSGLKAFTLAMLRKQGLEADEAAGANISEAFGQREVPGAPFQGPIDDPNRPLSVQDKAFAGDFPQGEFGSQQEREALATAMNQETRAELRPDPTGDRFGFPEPPSTQRQPTSQEIAQVLLQNPQNRQLGGQFLVQGREQEQAADLRAQQLADKQKVTQQAQKFTAEQNALQREATLQAAQGRQQFTAGESQLDRDFKASQSSLALDSKTQIAQGKQTSTSDQKELARKFIAGENKLNRLSRERVADDNRKAQLLRQDSLNPLEKRKLADLDKKEVLRGQKVRNSFNTFARKNSNLTTAIDKALEQTNLFFATGKLGALLGEIPATDARDLRATLDTIKANVGFDELQAMRANSPTGGALGQVSENENKLLQSVQASIDPSQSVDQLQSNLNIIRTLATEVLEERQGAFRTDFPEDRQDRRSTDRNRRGTDQGNKSQIGRFTIEVE